MSDLYKEVFRENGNDSRFCMGEPSEEVYGEKAPEVMRLRAAVRDALQRADLISEDWISEELDQMFWNTLALFSGSTFYTAKKLPFSYVIRGYEMFVSRKDKSITRATALLAFHTGLRLQKECGVVTGPKKLGTFGASYLYPIFLYLGIISPGK